MRLALLSIGAAALHTDADGNATVVRTFEKIGDC
jgi:hypothetical protein